MTRIQLACLAAAIAGAPATASAEPVSAGARQVTAGLFFGGNLVAGDSELGNAYFPDQVPGSGFLVGARGGIILLPGLAAGTRSGPRLGFELETKLAFSSTTAEASRDSYFAPILGWRAHAMVDLWSVRRLSPFALAGAGGETVFTSSPFVSSGDTDAAVHWGAGARWRISAAHGSVVRLELRHLLGAGRDDSLASSFEVHVGFGVAFDLGSGEPRIGKKVIADGPPPDPIDPDPIDPDPVDPPPAPDRDGDRVADADDRCPDTREDDNGVDQGDGCPETDEDGDGLVGSRDACEGDAEDLDGFQDDNGCPDLDNDDDGVPDILDQCANVAETVNGFDDEDGCDDSVPQAVQDFTGVAEGIVFAPRSARILPASRAVLGKSVVVLKKYPSLRIVVAGHTDNQGRAMANLELSARRALSVKAWFVGKGIAADRIETVGYGSDDPIADNGTEAGRKKNRRIELTLVKAAEP